MLKVLDLAHAERVFVVGDIHGAFSKLELALDDLGFNRKTDYLISVGDLVDRGEENERVLEFLEYSWFHAVRGNHEAMIIDPEQAYLSYQNGGKWFYDLDEYLKPIFRKAFAQLPYLLEVHVPSGKKIGIAHATYPDGDWNNAKDVVKDHYKSEKIIWDRSDIKLAKISGMGKHIANIDHVYHGHTPIYEPISAGNQSWIDTGGVFEEGCFTIVEIT